MVGRNTLKSAIFLHLLILGVSFLFVNGIESKTTGMNFEGQDGHQSEMKVSSTEQTDDNGGQQTRGKYLSIACENDYVGLICPGHDETIKIISAGYGLADLKVCPTSTINKHMMICLTYNVTHIASRLCDGKDFCELLAENSIYGDPCPGSSKYLKLTFECQ